MSAQAGAQETGDGRLDVGEQPVRAAAGDPDAVAVVRGIAVVAVEFDFRSGGATAGGEMIGGGAGDDRVVPVVRQQHRRLILADPIERLGRTHLFGGGDSSEKLPPPLGLLRKQRDVGDARDGDDGAHRFARQAQPGHEGEVSSGGAADDQQSRAVDAVEFGAVAAEQEFRGAKTVVAAQRPGPGGEQPVVDVEDGEAESAQELRHSGKARFVLAAPAAAVDGQGEWGAFRRNGQIKVADPALPGRGQVSDSGNELQHDSVPFLSAVISLLLACARRNSCSKRLTDKRHQISRFTTFSFPNHSFALVNTD